MAATSDPGSITRRPAAAAAVRLRLGRARLAAGAAGGGAGVAGTCQGSPGAGFFTLNLRRMAWTFSDGCAPTESQ